ncbi:MBL fold metallo-hydrolase [Neobacillus sp. PS3-34]|uniref:MBL fold metallo-hydrolase n=1 Tax=Neobacillus sp. PS3-34 TaxID=3070678 RepID=UPI0027DEC44A|nr:MBL fold metallo-hydrolase [Neobacillus sp. PS3-34]WML48354.1 MBL fold metallo-hydrolase [Neobacillus sp. PS3-34]
MKIHLLGTSAAEGFPGIFCQCEHCKKARILGGKNIRTRTSAIIDDILKIDFPPDTNLHVLRDGIDLSKITDLLITHTHSDHLYPEDLSMRLPIYAHGFDHPLHVYGHDLPIFLCRNRIGNTDGHIIYHHTHAYRTYEVSNYKVTPLLADHNKQESCMIFAIEKNEKSFLYGHDTGWFPHETWEWLKGKQMDLIILDCTNGHFPVRHNHLNIEAVKEMQGLFLQENILKKEGKIIVTHFSHNIGLQHQDLEDIFKPLGIEVAYDGKMIEI